MSCLYILEINPSSVALFANIFSHSEGCLSVLFMDSFAVQKILTINYICFQNIFSINFDSVVSIKKDNLLQHTGFSSCGSWALEHGLRSCGLRALERGLRSCGA